MRIGKGKVGKGRGIEIVLSILDFIGDLPSLNIVGYSVQKIKSGEIKRKLVKKLGLVGDEASDDEVRKAIIALCRSNHCWIESNPSNPSSNIAKRCPATS